MRTETRTKQVQYTVYITKDGKEFTSETDTKDHEKVLNGTRKVCKTCNGKGSTNLRLETYTYNFGYEKGERWTSDKCSDCGGKGYLEQKWV